jgi:hydrogenase expression/formation protein HypC
MCLAVPGTIVEIRDQDPTARVGTVDFGGVSKEINLSFVPEARVGDYVLVHAGFAINAIDEDEASKVFEYLREIEELGFGAEEAGDSDVRASGSREGAGRKHEEESDR